MRLEYRNKMQRVLATLMLVALIGCGGSSPQQEVPIDSFTIIDPDDPESIARWEASTYNIDNSKITVVKLRFFHGVLGDSTPKEPKSVTLELRHAKTNGIASEQQSAVDNFIQNELTIHAAVRDAIYKDYKKLYPIYKEALLLAAALYGGGEEMDVILPRISSGNELDDLVQFATIFIHPPVGGKASIGIYFNVPWTEDGIGLLLDDGKVVAIGIANEAFPPPQR